MAECHSAQSSRKAIGVPERLARKRKIFEGFIHSVGNIPRIDAQKLAA
jgi:hypothetical protein